jgi:TIR domain
MKAARKMAHDVFIGHSSADKPVADAVCAALEVKGLRCWIAPRDSDPSQSLAAAVDQAIAETPIYLLVFTGAANESSEVRREVAQAADQGKALLTLRIEDVLPKADLKFYLDGPHWLDATTPPLEKHWDKLADACAAVLALEPGHDAAPVTAAPKTAPMPADRADSPSWWRRQTRAAKVAVIAAVVVAVAAAVGVTGALLRPSPAAHGRAPSAASATAAAPAASAPIANPAGSGDPRAQIVQLTGSYSDQGFGKAIIDRDTRLVGLYLQSGMKATNFSNGANVILFGFQGVPQNGDPVELVKTFQANGFKVDDQLEDGYLMAALTNGFLPVEFQLTPKGFTRGAEGAKFAGTLLFWIVERASWKGPNDQDKKVIKYLTSQGADCKVPRSYLEDVGKNLTDKAEGTPPYDELHPLLQSCAK